MPGLNDASFDDDDTVNVPVPVPTPALRGNLIAFQERTKLMMPALRRPAPTGDHVVTSAPRVARGTPAPVLFARNSVTPLFQRAPTSDTAPMTPWSADPGQTFVPEAFVPEIRPATNLRPLPVAAAVPQQDPANTYQVPAPEPAPAEPKPERSPAWQTYHELGLAPKPSGRLFGRLIVSLYRLLGFAILTGIVVILVGYIVTTAFYYLNTTWITPIEISASDEKVVALQTQLAEQQNLRDRLANEIADADHAIAVQQEFQAEFAKAIESDLAGRRAALAKMRTLAGEAAGTRQQIRDTNDDYATESKARMDKEYEANLIDRGQMLNGKFQLAQISTANLSLAERQAELELRAADLAANSRSLAALLDKADRNRTPLSYDVLKIKQELETSKLALDKLLGDRATVQASLVRQDKIIAGVKSSSYLRVVTDHATVAFVPYGNLHVMKHGDPLYGCQASMVVCHQVGTVLEVLSGEVSFKHPHRDKLMRGQMVELQLADPQAAEDDVLFVGDKPLWF
jgi:hypothetical protein